MEFSSSDLSCDEFDIMLAVIIDLCDGFRAIEMCSDIFNSDHIANHELLSVVCDIDSAGCSGCADGIDGLLIEPELLFK